jgi:hypothetical protein
MKLAIEFGVWHILGALVLLGIVAVGLVQMVMR